MPNKKDTIKIINYALQSDNKKVIVLKGEWGIGKTYLWKEQIQLSLPVYQKCGYVSLFGKSSIQEINKAALSAVYLVNKTSKITHKARQITSVLNSATENFAKINTAVQGIDALLSVLNRENLKNTIICFDDLERMDENIKLKDFFGFVNELAEHQECKVILIFNENELFNIEKIENTKNINNDKNNSEVVEISENQKIYNKFKEKTIDLEVTYTPEFEDNFNIACDIINNKLEDKYKDIIKNVLYEVEETNIRIISKCIDCVNDFMNTVNNIKDRLTFYNDLSNTILLEIIKSITYITQQYWKAGHKYWDSQYIENQQKNLTDNEFLYYKLPIGYDKYVFQGKYLETLNNYFQGYKFNENVLYNYLENYQLLIQYYNVHNKIREYGKIFWNTVNGNKDTYINDMCELFKNNNNAYSFFMNVGDAELQSFLFDNSVLRNSDKFKEVFYQQMNKAIDNYIHEYQNSKIQLDDDVVNKIEIINEDKIKFLYKKSNSIEYYIEVINKFIKHEETEADKFVLEQIKLDDLYNYNNENSEFFIEIRDLFFERDLYSLQNNIPHFLYIVAQYLLNTINENPDNEFKYNILGKHHSKNNEYNAKQDIEDYIKEYEKIVK